ncbi:hypothetical protein AYL99_10746 [Fonsecaea erecta]|uniref:Uncharacterized protein n=1 Tax=Fonsecaea erecta TaxID=1367422 RepID=A0A178Z6F4_9EURO|nr:hypothetical protein AYL99_10746 [Fonsecaea erecta]OAP55046.1 hypothetical protein AYL99_10746 [Fonsecaea erecta]
METSTLADISARRDSDQQQNSPSTRPRRSSEACEQDLHSSRPENDQPNAVSHVKIARRRSIIRRRSSRSLRARAKTRAAFFRRQSVSASRNCVSEVVNVGSQQGLLATPRWSIFERFFNNLRGGAVSCFELLSRLLNVPIAAATNLATSAYLGPIILCLFILAICLKTGLIVHLLVTSFKDGYTNGSSLAHKVYLSTISATAAGYNRLASVQSFAVDSGNRFVSALGATGSAAQGILCLSPAGAKTVSWLGYPCELPEGSSENFFDTLNMTTIEVGHWVNISGLVLPHSNYLSMANIAVGKYSLVVRHSRVDFPDKHALANSMDIYSELLLEGGHHIFTTVLQTESTVMLMHLHLQEAERELERISRLSPIWSWRRTSRFQVMFTNLIRLVDLRILDLISEIQACVKVLEKAEKEGNQYLDLVRSAENYIEKKIEEKGYVYNLLHPDNILVRTKSFIPQLHMPIPEVLEHLRSAKINLIRHRQHVTISEKDLLFLRTDYPGTSGVNIILARLKMFAEQLSSSVAQSKFQREAQERREEAERKEGYYRLPHANNGYVTAS